VIFRYLDVATGPQKQPHVADVRCPSVAFDTRPYEPGMNLNSCVCSQYMLEKKSSWRLSYEVISPCFKYLRVVETIVEVIYTECQIVWLVRDKHWKDIDSGHLIQSDHTSRITADFMHDGSIKR
jgi:hypothetical protein